MQYETGNGMLLHNFLHFHGLAFKNIRNGTVYFGTRDSVKKHVSYFFIIISLRIAFILPLLAL